MASTEVCYEISLSDRGREMVSRLGRLASQAKRGSRRKMRRLMKKGRRIGIVYLERRELFRFAATY